MSSLVPVSEALTAMANWMMAFAACAGAIAAFSGLHTWKKQGLWQQDNELARKALLSLRRKHDALKFLRHPFVSSGEMINALEDDAKKDFVDQGWAAAIDKRIERLREANESVYPILVEASAAWGDEIESEFRKLDEIELQVRIAIEGIYRNNKRGGRVEKEEIATRRIAFSSSSDPTSEEYDGIVEGLRVVFKRKLGRT